MERSKLITIYANDLLHCLSWVLVDVTSPAIALKLISCLPGGRGCNIQKGDPFL
jgi:hypothetical protein